MTDECYRPEYASGAARLSHDIGVAGEPDAPTLTCRWPAAHPPKAFVVFCHGLGGSDRGYEAISRFWAEHGYFVVHPLFSDWINSVAAAEPELGLDPSADLFNWTATPSVQARMHEILHTPSYWLARIRIVRRVLDNAGAIMSAAGGVTPDPMPIAIAGHSFGAYTAQLFAGAEIDLPEAGASRFKDGRCAAAILLSAQGRDQQGLREGSWDGISGPMLNVTGTRDGGAKGQDWRWKCEPYDFAPPGAKYLAVLQDADHYLGGFSRARPEVPEQRSAVEQLTLAFLDAHVAGDAEAATWLGSVSGRVGRCPVLFKRK